MLFDLDGVILDSMAGHVASWRTVFSRRGLNVSAEFIYEHEGALGHDVLDKLFESHGRVLVRDEVSELFEEQVDLYMTVYMPQVRPYPGVFRLVADLGARGLRLALVTSSRRQVVLGGLPPELASVFGVIISSDRVKNYKPHPEPYLAAMSDLGLEAGSCLAVENAPAGIDSARGAGLRVFGVMTTLSADHLSGAHRIFGDIGELGTHLKNLTG